MKPDSKPAEDSLTAGQPRLQRWLKRRLVRYPLLGLAGLLTLIFLGYAIENYRGWRAWKNLEKELLEAGVKFDHADFAPPPVAPEENFFATPFLQPIHGIRYDRETEEVDFGDRDAYSRVANFGQLIAPDFSSPFPDLGHWRNGELTDLAVWQAAYAASTNFPSPPEPNDAAADVLLALRKFEPELSELREASRRPHARYNLQYDHPNPVMILLPHLGMLRNTTRISALRAIALLRQEKPGAAFEELEFILRIANTLEEEPFLISQLVRFRILEYAAQVLWEGIQGSYWSEAQLANAINRLSGIELVPALDHAFQFEEAAGHKIIVLVSRNNELLADLGSARTPSAADPSPGRFLLNLIPDGWFYFELCSYHEAYRKFVFPGIDSQANKIEVELVKSNDSALEEWMVKNPPIKCILKHRVMSALLLPALSAAAQRTAYVQSTLDMAVIACALERHRLAEGQHPARLEDLVPASLPSVPNDVLKDEPFRYQRDGNGGFLLYSVGWNLEDDGGKYAWSGKGRSRPDIDQGDWVWPQLHGAEEN